MKCYKCNGTGYYDIDNECPVCDGTGEYEPFDLDVELDKMDSEPQTNEEWFCQLSTEEKAKVLRRKTHGNDEENERIEQGWVNWLKAKHEDNPPDIPSVPSWEKWLEGERTKCEYCDGISAECNLTGKFECPKTPKTNEEWLRSATTEELAKYLQSISVLSLESKDEDLEDWKQWLKEIHE